MLCRAAPLFRGYDFARPFSFMNGLKRSKAPDAFTGSGLAPTPYNLIKGVVMLLEKGAQTIMRQCFYFVVVAADHVVIVDQGVDDASSVASTVAVKSGSIRSFGIVSMVRIGGLVSAAWGLA